jgi:hypothetical protein
LIPYPWRELNGERLIDESVVGLAGPARGIRPPQKKQQKNADLASDPRVAGET